MAQNKEQKSKEVTPNDWRQRILNKLNNNDDLEKEDYYLIQDIYGNLFQELMAILNQYDPIGLYIPELYITNEYNLEVSTIIVQLGDAKNEDDVINLVYKEFKRWFASHNTERDYKIYTEMAKAIYKWKVEKFVEPQ
ncbi:MAG TPA: hypothetical protein PKI34_01130 [Bacteroidales bacterium]|nr:hypothetical protein [Bacteroidales bacterium]